LLLRRERCIQEISISVYDNHLADFSGTVRNHYCKTDHPAILQD
jgi:hypothetical protein